MEILYIDPIAGASGDMFLGALVDLGVDFDQLRDALRSLGVKGFDLQRSETKRHAIAATKVDVVVDDVAHPHRHLRDLLKIIDSAPLTDAVKQKSSAVLTRLAEAEARAHRMPVERVHLHEVGGLDCLVDVVGTVLAIESLGVTGVYSAPVSLGAGFQKCAHGVMPVPVPGTLAILEGFPVRRTDFPHEMTTPTGAALIAVLAQPARAPFLMTPKAIGHGAGTKDVPHVANLLRLVRAEVDPRNLRSADREHHHDHEPHDHGHHDHDHDHDHEHPHAHDHHH